jgi:hypothetical protein
MLGVLFRPLLVRPSAGAESCRLVVEKVTILVNPKNTRLFEKGAPLYPRRLRDLRSVERMVMNKRASLTLGDSKMKRHKEVETLRTSNKRNQSSS